MGILIAVSINDWNDSRKQRAVAINYFRNLRNDLTADINGIENLIALSERKIIAAKNIRHRMEQDSVGSIFEFSDDIEQLIFVGSFTPNQNTYEEMLNSGNFSLIQNDSIKLKLMALNQSYILIRGAQDHVRHDYHIFLKSFQKNLDWGNYYDLDNSPPPSSFDSNEPYILYDSLYIADHANALKNEASEMFKDKVFANNIFLIEVNYTYYVPLLQNLKTAVNDIIILIDAELAEN